VTENFQLFNLETMSGVFPGTRTMVYQRVRLEPLDKPADRGRWARILWYDDPAAWVVELEASGAAVSPAAEATPAPPRTLLRISEPLAADAGRQLRRSLEAAGWQLRCCGTCASFQPLAATTPDGLSAGRCTWRSGDAVVQEVPSALAAQSQLALACERWALTGGAEIPVLDDEVLITVAPMPKRAEQETDERWTFWGRLRRALGRSQSGQESAAERQPSWEERLVERSGVGAGTEPCFACQGRIANLGALAVATPEGDKQTFSVWRCRSCFTYYLNDWIDRWERTDSLETEESYYRLSPAEALEVLAVIDGVADAEHPARRYERDAQRRWMLDYLANRPYLSHQVRQGR
jgi:uncharacterized protein with PIN domain